MPLPQGHAAGLHEIGSTTHCLLLFLVSPPLTCSSCPPGPTGDRGHRLKRLVLRPHGVHPASLPAVPSIFLPKAYRHRWPRLPAEARRPRPVHSRRRGKERSGKSQSSSGSAGSRSQGAGSQGSWDSWPGRRIGRSRGGRQWGGPGAGRVGRAGADQERGRTGRPGKSAHRNHPLPFIAFPRCKPFWPFPSTR